jgi:hypothetical protein
MIGEVMRASFILEHQRLLVASFSACALSLCALVADPAAAQLCDGKAYFQPLVHRDIEIGHLTSRSATPLGNWEQTNCVVLRNDGAVRRDNIVGTFGFESGQGGHTIRTMTTQVLTGGVPVLCNALPDNPNGPDVNAEIQPVGGSLSAGQYTHACCFVFEAQSPQSVCENLPGPGDLASVALVVQSGGPVILTNPVPGIPQSPACGLIGIEALLVLSVLRGRRPRLGRRRLRKPLGVASLAGVVLVLALPARAGSFSVGPGTSVDVTLTALTHVSKPAALGGNVDVEVTLQAGVPTQVRFNGPSLTVGALSLASSPLLLLVDITADITASTARLESGAIPITGGIFDPSLVTVVLDSGVFTGTGSVFGNNFTPARDFSNLPATLPNEDSGTKGTVTVSPGVGGFDVTVTLPLRFASPLSSNTGIPWLIVEDSTLELTGQVASVSLPTLSTWPTFGMCLALGVCALIAMPRVRAASS